MLGVSESGSWLCPVLIFKRQYIALVPTMQGVPKLSMMHMSVRLSEPRDVVPGSQSCTNSNFSGYVHVQVVILKMLHLLGALGCVEQCLPVASQPPCRSVYTTASSSDAGLRVHAQPDQPAYPAAMSRLYGLPQPACTVHKVKLSRREPVLTASCIQSATDDSDKRHSLH